MKKLIVLTSIVLGAQNIFAQTPVQILQREEIDESLSRTCQVYEIRMRSLEGKKAISKQYYKILRDIPDTMEQGETFSQVFKFKKQLDWHTGSQGRIKEINQRSQEIADKSFLKFSPQIVEVLPLVVRSSIELKVDSSAIIKIGDGLNIERYQPEFEETAQEYRIKLKGRDSVCDFLSKRISLLAKTDLAVQFDAAYVERMREQAFQALAVFKKPYRDVSKFERAARQGIELYKLFYELQHRNGFSDSIIISEIGDFYKSTVHPLTGELIEPEAGAIESKYPFEGVLKNENLEFQSI